MIPLGLIALTVALRAPRTASLGLRTLETTVRPPGGSTATA